MSRLRPDVQEELGRNLLQAADGTARGAEGLIERLKRSPGSWPDGFVRGLLLETLVDDKNSFRLKGAWLPEALAVALAHDRAGQILGATTGRVQSSEPKSSLVFPEDPEDGKNDYDKAADILEESKGTLARRELVDELISAVRRARPPEP